jgi:hypothetical protein
MPADLATIDKPAAEKISCTRSTANKGNKVSERW